MFSSFDKIATFNCEFAGTCKFKKSSLLSVYHKKMIHYFSFFSQDEEEFVEEIMAQFLEGLGFRICCHRRDFDLGIPIEQNIEEATVHSRRIICVKSR